MKRILVGAAVLASVAFLGGEAAAQSGTARGKVVDDKDQALEGAVVLLEYQGGVTRKNETKTNKKGEFTQVGLAPGTYRITATKEGFAPVTIEYRIQLGEPTYLPNIKLSPPRAAGAAGPADPAAEKAMAELRAGVDQAIALTKEGKLDEAEAAYKDLIAKNPTFHQLHYNLGYVQSLKKDNAGAEASYLKALEIKPDYAEAQTGPQQPVPDDRPGGQGHRVRREGGLAPTRPTRRRSSRSATWPSTPASWTRRPRRSRRSRRSIPATPRPTTSWARSR